MLAVEDVRLALLLAGSVSAGVHAGLAPEHLEEWAPLGASFVVAAAAAAAAVVALVLRPDDPRPRHALGLLFGSLVAAYVATRLVPLPPLDPEREQPDLLGVVTTLVEAAGLALVLPSTRLAGGTR